MGGSCGAGAVAGELTAEYAYNNLHLDKNTSIALASVTSAGAALLTSSLQGNDDEHTAKNVQLGSILGSNAAENNAVSDGIGVSHLDEESQNYRESKAQLDDKLRSVKVGLQTNLADIAATSGSSLVRGTSYGTLVGVNVLFPESVDEIGLSLIGGGLGAFESSALARTTAINITENGLSHTIDRHTINEISKWNNKSKFYDSSEVENLITNSVKYTPIQQPNGNLARIVNSNKTIGFDKITGQPTSQYTVITNPKGDLVTAFPGKPNGY